MRISIIIIFYVLNLVINKAESETIHRNSQSQKDRNTYKDILESLERLCKLTCRMYAKEIKHCGKYCSFVPHIARDHMEELLDLHLEYPKARQVMDWVMVKVTEWKIETEEDDTHIIGEKFINLVKEHLEGDIPLQHTIKEKPPRPELKLDL